jgi:hypothetical protein
MTAGMISAARLAFGGTSSVISGLAAARLVLAAWDVLREVPKLRGFLLS